MRMILISGIPGAGKTTVSRLLAARLLPRSVHIEGDLIGHHFIGAVSFRRRDRRRTRPRRRSRCGAATSVYLPTRSPVPGSSP
jgi:adenylylsulfate kinase-like enzyme